MNRIQNLVRSISAENKSQEALGKAIERQQKKEKSGMYKWITIGKSSKLHLLCRIDKDGKLTPKEVERIKRIKKTLGI